MAPQYGNGNDRAAPLLRNNDMAVYGDVLVAIWDGHSRGTKHMISTMQSKSKPVYVMRI